MKFNYELVQDRGVTTEPKLWVRGEESLANTEQWLFKRIQFLLRETPSATVREFPSELQLVTWSSVEINTIRRLLYVNSELWVKMIQYSMCLWPRSLLHKYRPRRGGKVGAWLVYTVVHSFKKWFKKSLYLLVWIIYFFKKAPKLLIIYITGTTICHVP